MQLQKWPLDLTATHIAACSAAQLEVVKRKGMIAFTIIVLLAIMLPVLFLPMPQTCSPFGIGANQLLFYLVCVHDIAQTSVRISRKLKTSTFAKMALLKSHFRNL